MTSVYGLEVPLLSKYIRGQLYKLCLCAKTNDKNKIRIKTKRYTQVIALYLSRVIKTLNDIGGFIFYILTYNY